MMRGFVNDLEAPAFSLRPELGEMRQAAERVAGRAVRMSGSGSSLFTLCDSETEAAGLAERVRNELRIAVRVAGLAPSA
jgi:4-diphosphocytidyl-2C-methyl-D-erythritol kinase